MPMGNKEYEQDTQTLGGAYKQFVVWDGKWVYVDPAKVPGEGQAGSRPQLRTARGRHGTSGTPRNQG